MPLIPPQDAAFLTVESREHPMHVGALQVFDLPSGAKADYVSRLYEQSLEFTEVRSLMRQRPRTPVSSLGQLWWETDDDVDLEYHVRLSALPAPGRVRELFTLVSRLHGNLLDRHRPLWECHLIDGLEGGRFAIYTKFHHSMVDGAAGMRLMTGALTEDPTATIPPFWALPDGAAEPAPGDGDGDGDGDGERTNLADRLLGSVLGAAESVRTMAAGTVDLAKLLTEVLRGQRDAVTLPAPKTMWNGSITGARRFAAQSWEIDRLKSAAAASGGTLNDVALAMCAGALRRYLQEAGALPERSLISLVAVSLALRGVESGSKGGNAAGAVLCSLGTNIASPEQRMAVIRASMQTAKDILAAMTPAQVQASGSLLLAAPLAIGAVPGLLGLTSPLFNVRIFNVPGPRNDLFWNGARLANIYLVSIPYEGQGLNFTVTSSAGWMHFGITGCPRSVPHLQRLLGYLEDSLAELGG